jgi:hypothetical protein
MVIKKARHTEQIADRNSYKISIGNRQDKQPLGQRKNKQVHYLNKYNKRVLNKHMECESLFSRWLPERPGISALPDYGYYELHTACPDSASTKLRPGMETRKTKEI